MVTGVQPPTHLPVSPEVADKYQEQYGAILHQDLIQPHHVAAVHSAVAVAAAEAGHSPVAEAAEAAVEAVDADTNQLKIEITSIEIKQ